MQPREELKPVYYLYGKEDYLLEEALRTIKDRALASGLEAMNYHLYDGDVCDPGEVTVACETLPAFSEKRLVVVRRAESLSEEKREVFLSYIENPSPTTILVFVSSSDKVGGGPFFKLLEEKGYIRRFNRLFEKEAYAWIRKEASRRGRTITDGAVSRLMEASGGRMRDLKGELEKIALFTEGKKAIDERDVEAASSDCREDTVFKLSDAIGRKDAPEALRIYGKISADAGGAIGAIARHMRILIKIKALKKKGAPPQEVSSALGFKGRILENYLRSSLLFEEEELIDTLKGFYLLDRALKSGGSKTLMHKLIIDLCGPRKAAR